jgi:protein transport protein SEC23
MIMSDNFASAIFKQSFQKMFAKDEKGHLLLAFNASLEIWVMS